MLLALFAKNQVDFCYKIASYDLDNLKCPFLDGIRRLEV